MKKNLFINIFFAVVLLLQSCKQKTVSDEEEQPAEVITPVTVTNPATGTMAETVGLNAVSSFLLKTSVKATTTGYLEKVNAQLGKYVSKGQILFVIKTKEAQALGNTVNKIDSSLHFEGTINIKSPGDGFISDLTLTAEDYVQEGEQLAAITNTNSFVFLLDLPYELKPYLPNNKTLQLYLPDSTMLNGVLHAPMPVADSATQTQRYIIRVNANKPIPENLIAKVYLVKAAKQNVIALPTAAVLSDEVQSEFWIMKMINDSTAVKVPVKKGMETKDNVEIVSPPLATTDKILLTGNYGLPDTAKVRVMKSESQ
ncbi:MAG TPA: HlyD family efflux transporter periplasmic adaptor subunit [Chitinophagaceae bacterium]|nr:HlyD family efflux transporter periplasmic adaptor subunit [Chitinophagaceae bacterium]